MNIYKSIIYIGMILVGIVFVFDVYAPAEKQGYLISTLMIVQNDLEDLAKERKAVEYEQKIEQMREEYNKTYQWYRKMPSEYRDYIIELNKSLEIPPALIYYLIKWESGWHKTATGYNMNGTSDLGLMQLNSRYVHAFVEAHFTGDPKNFDPYNGKHNLEVGLKHLEYLHDYLGDWKSAAQAYNAGKGRIKRGYVPEFAQHYASMTYEKANRAGGIQSV